MLASFFSVSVAVVVSSLDLIDADADDSICCSLLRVRRALELFGFSFSSAMIEMFVLIDFIFFGDKIDEDEMGVLCGVDVADLDSLMLPQFNTLGNETDARLEAIVSGCVSNFHFIAFILREIR